MTGQPEKSAGSPAPAQPAATTSPAAIAAAPASPSPGKPPVDQNSQVVVFGYHRFVEKVRRPDTEITPAAFEAQMAEFKERGVAVISMQDFLAWKRGEKSIPPKSAIITFDDGWKSQYDVGWPILKKYGYPMTLFIYTEGIRPGHFSGGESMSWEHLEEMRDAGVDIQAHSRTHQDLRKPYDKIARKKLNPEEYEEWLDKELAGSKAELEQKLGIKVSAFAVPYGFYNDHVKEKAMKAGYEGLFTVYGQRLSIGAPMDSLGRYIIEANKPKVFEQAVSFTGASAGGNVPLADAPTTQLLTEPAEGGTIKTATPLIKANLAPFGQIDPGSVQMRISGLGVVPANYDPKTQTLSYQVAQKLHDKNCTVIVTAKSGGRKVESRWTFSIADGTGAPPPPAPTPRK